MTRTDKAESWRRRTLKGMPALAARVFALRGVAYQGHGFHWALEREMGRVLARLNDYDSPFGVAVQITTEVIVENLYRDVSRAEGSAGPIAGADEA